MLLDLRFSLYLRLLANGGEHFTNPLSNYMDTGISQVDRNSILWRILQRELPWT
jgi:hypothetical protein